MPDTPRTVLELKAIFADNSSGDISAQDMRDFVESVAVARSPKTLAHFSLTVAASTSPPSENNQGIVTFDLHGPTDTDPDGWLSAGTYASPDWWGDTFAAGQTVSLPPGLFLVSCMAQFHSGSDIPDGAAGQLDFVGVDNRLADELSGSYYAIGPSPVNTYASLAFDPTFHILPVEGEHVIPIPDDHDAFHFALAARVHGFTPDSWAGQLAIWQLA